MAESQEQPATESPDFNGRQTNNPLRRHTVDDIKRRRIDNPLRHYTLEELDHAAQDFARKIGADEKLFVKGARLARDPPGWRSVEGLTDEETLALKHEKEWGFLKQPQTLKTTIVALVFSAITHGWVQSVSNGANQTMPEYFGLKSRCGTHSWEGRSAIWQFSAINGITYLAAGVLGCWFSDPLQSKFLGRRGAIFVSACICFGAAIGAACATKWWEELVWRLILGLGLGAKASVTPIFGAEVSPSHLRGMLVMNWQLFDALGIFCGFTANLVFYRTQDLAWRFQIASSCVPAGALLVLILTIPESPRWLLKKGRVKASYHTLCKLRHTPLQAAAELFYAHAQIQMEIEYMRNYPPLGDYEVQANEANGHHQGVDQLSDLQYYRNAVQGTNYWSRILQLFRNGRTRRATIASTVVMLGQQLCGVNVLAFYSTVFFRDINQYRSKDLNALWMSWGLGLANFLFTFPAYWGIDMLGRRFLLLSTYPGMIVSMFGASMSFLGGTNDERNVRVGVFMFFFILFYSLGQGPVAFAYSSEVFPLFNREAGMSWAVFVNLFGAGLLTLFVPLFQVSSTTHPNDVSAGVDSDAIDCNATAPLDSLSILSDALSSPEDWGTRQAQLLGAFVCFATLSFLLIFCFVPETKLAASGRRSVRSINYISLEELNHIFKVHTRDFMRWQLTKVLPYEWEVMKYVLGIGKVKGQPRKKPRLEVMYRWAEDRRDNDDDEGDTELQSVTNGISGGMRDVQRAYNPSPDDERRGIHNRGPQQNVGIRRVPDGDGDDLALPNPPYQQAERAGSIDWDPSEHPSPEVSPAVSRVRLPGGEVARVSGGDAAVGDDDADGGLGRRVETGGVRAGDGVGVVGSGKGRAESGLEERGGVGSQVPGDDGGDTAGNTAGGGGGGGDNTHAMSSRTGEPPPRTRRKPVPGNSRIETGEEESGNGSQHITMK